VNKTIRVLSTVAVAGGMSLVLAGAGMAQEQARPAPPPPGAGAGPGSGPGVSPEAMRARMRERMQQRLKEIHDALGLRPDQEAAWNTLAAALRPPAGGPRGGMMERQGEAGAGLTTPQRLDRMAQRMAERQARFQQHAEAIKRFYAVLDARQQKTFDALIGARMGRFGMGGGPHGMGGGRGGMMGR
jgi:hypothetical protein